MPGVPGVSGAPRPPKDPMKGFRGVMSGALVLEAITVALALPVVAKLHGGIGTGTGWAVGAVAVALVACCRFVKRPWVLPVILALQLVLVAFVVTLPSISVLGIVFLGIWLWLLRLRRDVAGRIAQGLLPGGREPR